MPTVEELIGRQEDEISAGNLVSQFLGGVVTGFSTLNVGEDPRNSAEAIANSLGHLLGFIGVIPGVGSIGSVGARAILGSSRLAAGALAGRNLGAARRFLKVGQTAAGPVSNFKSVPFLVSDFVVGRASKLAKSSATLSSMKFLDKTTLAGSLTEGAARLGVASSASAWQNGVDEMMNAFFHGAVFGGVFRGIGEVPALRHKGPGGPELKTLFGGDDNATRFGLRMMAGSFFQGLPATIAGAPVEMQVYDYLLGAYFGGKEISRHQRSALEFIRESMRSPQDRPFLMDLQEQHLRGNPLSEGFRKLHPEAQAEVETQVQHEMGKFFDQGKMPFGPMTEQSLAMHQVAVQTMKRRFAAGEISREAYVEHVRGTLARLMGEEVSREQIDAALFGPEAVVTPRDPEIPGSRVKLTNEWQVVPQDAVLPNGAEVRINMETGETLARLISAGKSSNDPPPEGVRSSDAIRDAENDFGLPNRLQSDLRILAQLIAKKDVHEAKKLGSKFAEPTEEDLVAFERNTQRLASEVLQEGGSFLEFQRAFESDTGVSIKKDSPVYRSLIRSWHYLRSQQPEVRAFYGAALDPVTGEVKTGMRIVTGPVMPDGELAARHRPLSYLEQRIRNLEEQRERPGFKAPDAQGGRIRGRIVMEKEYRRERQDGPVDREQETYRIVSNPIHDAEALRGGRVLDLLLEADRKGAFFVGGVKEKDRMIFSQLFVEEPVEAESIVRRYRNAMVDFFTRPEAAAKSEDPERSFLFFKNLFHRNFREHLGDEYDAARIEQLFHRYYANNIVLYESLQGRSMNKILEDVAAVKGDYILDPVNLNKRMQVLDAGEAEIEPWAFRDISDVTEGSLNVLIARMGGGKELVEGMASTRMTYKVRAEDGTVREAEHDQHHDGVFLLRADVFDALSSYMGEGTSTGAQKGTLRYSNENEGLIIGKFAYHRATEAVSKSMQANESGPLHAIALESAVKQRGSRPIVQLQWKQKGGFKFFLQGDPVAPADPANGGKLYFSRKPAAKSIPFVKIPTSGFTIARSEGESAELKGPVDITRQLHDKLNIYQGEPQAIQDWHDNFTMRSIQGDPDATRVAQDLVRREHTAQEVRDLDIDQIGLGQLSYILTHARQGSPLYEKAVRHILNRAVEDPAMLSDASEAREAAETVQSTEQMRSAADLILGTWPIEPMTMDHPSVKPYWNTVLRAYYVNRALKPKMKTAWQSIGGPLMMDTLASLRAEPGVFYAHAGARDIPVTGPKGETTLGELYKLAQKDPTAARFLEWAVIRNPADSMSGTRILRFGGFVDNKGREVVLHPMDMIYLGGMDLDIDKTSNYQAVNLPSSVVESIRRNAREWHEGDVLNMAKSNPERFLTRYSERGDLVESYREVFGREPTEEALQGLMTGTPALMDPLVRFTTARGSAQGNRLLGVGLNATKRAHTLHQMITSPTGTGILRDIGLHAPDYYGSPRSTAIRNPDVLTRLGVDPEMPGVKVYFTFKAKRDRGQGIRRVQLDVVNFAADAANTPNLIGREAILRLVGGELAEDVRFYKRQGTQPAERISLTKEEALDLFKDVWTQAKPVRQMSALDRLVRGRNRRTGRPITFDEMLSSARRNALSENVPNTVYRALSALGETGRPAGRETPRWLGAQFDKVIEVFHEAVKDPLFLESIAGPLSVSKGGKSWQVFNDVYDIASASLLYQQARAIDAPRQEKAQRLRQIAREINDFKELATSISRERAQGRVDGSMSDLSARVKQYRDQLPEAYREYFDTYFFSSLLGRTQRGARKTSLTQQAWLLGIADPAVSRRYGRRMKEIIQATRKKNLSPEDVLGIELAKAEEGAPNLQRSNPDVAGMNDSAESRDRATQYVRRVLTEGRIEGDNTGEGVSSQGGQGDRASQGRTEAPTPELLRQIEILTNQRVTLENHQQVLIDYLGELLYKNPRLNETFQAFFEGVTSEGDFFGIGRSIRLASLHDLVQFLNGFGPSGRGPNMWMRDILERQRQGLPLKWYHWFFFPETIGERHRAFDPNVMKLKRPVMEVLENGTIEIQERPVHVFKSSADLIHDYLNNVTNFADGQKNALQTRLDERFNLFRENERASELVPIAVGLREGPLFEQLGHEIYRTHRQEAEQRLQAMEQEGVRFRLVDGTEATPREAIRKINEEITRWAEEFKSTYLINEEAERQFIVTDEGGNVDVSRTLKRILDPLLEHGTAPIVGWNGLTRVIHQAMLDRTDVSWLTGATERQTLGELQGTHKARVQEQLYEHYPQLQFTREQGAFDTNQYWPHGGWTRSWKEHLAEQRERFAREGAHTNLQNRVELAARLAHARGTTPDGGHAIDLADGLTRDFISQKHIEEIGFKYKPSNILHRNGRGEPEPLDGYDMTLGALNLYQSQITKGYWNTLGSLASSRVIDKFEQRNPMGELTQAWARFMRVYARDNLGAPSLFPQEWLNDPNLKVKGTLYRTATDDFWTKAADRIGAKWFNGGGLHEGGDPRLGAMRLARFSQLEGKYELMTLLSHSKALVNNLFGGNLNTVISTGWEPWRKTFDFNWIRTNINPNWKTKEDMWKDVDKHGGVENYLINELHGETFKRIPRWGEFVDEALAAVRRNPNLADNELWSIAKSKGISRDIFNAAAFPMRSSERILRRKAWLAHLIKAHKTLNMTGPSEIFPWNHPWVITMANKGVQATQFLYNNANRPGFARTSMGRVFSRFQLWTARSIYFRKEIFKEARKAGFRPGTEQHARMQRAMQSDLFIFGLASLLPYSMFDSALAPPMSHLQEATEFFFGDEKERKRAFFGVLPYPLNITQAVSPPIARIPESVFGSLLSDDWDRFVDYHLWTWAPFGRITRDIRKTIENPIMAPERLVGFPLRGIHRSVRDLRDEEFRFVTPFGASKWDVD